MIRENTIEAVYPLSEKLARRGIKVTPLETTPVHQLVQAGHLEIPAAGPEGAELPIEDRIMEGSTSKDASGVVRHDVVMEELVETIAQSVRNNLDVARNVVNPIIRQVAEEAEQYMNDAESVRKTHISIVPDFYAEVWNSPTLGEMVERYSETAPEDFKLRAGFEVDTDFESLKQLAHTGASRFDEEIDELFDRLGEDQVAYVFRALFGRDAASVADRFSDFVNTRGNRNHALLAHLFARSLIQDPPEGTGMGLEEYREYMALMIAQSGRVVYRVMRMRETDRERRQLIQFWPANLEVLGNELIEIKVNGDVYTRWLEDGGEPEVLMGALISDQNRSYTDLIENKERYIREWQRQERVLGTTQRLNRFNNAVDGLRLAIGRQINDLDDELLIVSRDILHERLEKDLTKLYGHFYERMYEYARRLVCDVIFPHTDALQILCAIDHVVEDHPEIEIREAALLATIEVVSRWVAKLCRVEYLRV